MTDGAHDDRTREMAPPERPGGESPAEAATAPQPLPSDPDTDPKTGPENEPQPESGPPSPQSARATAPQPLPDRPQQAQRSLSPGEAKVTAPQTVPPAPPAPRPPSDQPKQPGQSGQPAHPAPVTPLPAPSTARRSTGFHRFHFPIGIFLVAYGVTALISSFLGWEAHLREMSDYLGEGAATPALVAVKVVQILLVLVTLMGLLRRRDVWFLPALCGWAVGFAVFCVLDGVKGTMADLVEHGVYLVGFAFLLCLSYALGVKARVAARRAARGGDGPDGDDSDRLSRTQELALAALERWRRQFQQPGPPQPHGTPRQVSRQTSGQAPPAQR